MPSNLPEKMLGLKTLLERVDQLKVELDSLRPLDTEQEARVMQKFRLDWNYHSNSIEGNSLTYDETIAFLMEGLTAKGKPFKDHLDIKGHNEAINYLMEMIKNHQALTEKAIRELHKVILVEPYKTPAQTQGGVWVEKEVTLGAYKKLPNHVKTPTGEIHYYATPEETPSKMADLMAWLHEEQEKQELPPLIIAAIFHYRFVAIHPFDDGNGRMSRLLMNLLLMQAGYPPVVIKQEERNLYYNALRQADSGDMEAFVEFIGGNLVHSLEIYLKGAKGESIEDEGDLDKEIALLKISLSGEKELVPKSQSIITALLLKTFLPLFQDIQRQSSKLDDLFFTVSGIVRNNRDVSKPHLVMSDKNWLDIEEIISNPAIIKLSYNVDDPVRLGNFSHIFIYEYNWINFKKAPNSFSIKCTLVVIFQEFKYDIEFIGSHIEMKISKSYRENLSKKELKEISTVFLREGIEEIKKKTSR